MKIIKILILGVAYKKNVADYRKSPAIDLINLLNEAGVIVSYHDPHVAEIKEPETGDIYMESVDINKGILKTQDLVIITTDHVKLDYKHMDTRNVLKGFNDPKIHAL